jgi:hypothetical protein
MKIYSPNDWYWFVGGDKTKVFSSKLGDYVSSDDVTFVAWASDGTKPTDIDTEEALGQVLAPYLIRPVHASVLDGYTGAQAAEVAADPSFKVIFSLMKQVASLQGTTPPTAAQALDATKALL